MIQSRFSSNTILTLLIAPLITVAIGLLLYDNINGYFFNHYPITKQSANGNHMTVLLLLLFFAFLLCVLATILVYQTLQNIIINSIDRTITFRKTLSGKSKIIRYDEISGYYDSIKYTSQAVFYKVLLLNSNGYIVGTIASIKYSNYDKMEKEIEKLKYLGKMQYSLTDKLKMLQGKRLSKASS